MIIKKKRALEDLEDTADTAAYQRNSGGFWARYGALVVGGVLLLVLSAGVAAFIVLQERDNVVVTNVDQDGLPDALEPTVYYSNLSGVKVDDMAGVNAPVTAIMIENSPEARPQSGLKNSGVVFEAIAEGGITRFLVLYQSEKPKLVGPVRSVRLYYVDWLTPFQASVAHVGGSAKALKLLRNGNYRDIDEFFNEQTYWRADDRWAPHDVYTSFKNIDALNKKRGYKTSDFVGFARKDDSALETPTAKKIAINISSSVYNSSYAYDAATNSYKRKQGGAAHKDREAGQIAPKVVIAMMVDEKEVMEDGYREQITTVGKGKAYVFQDGNLVVGTWRKDARGSQIGFFDEAGEKIALNRGQTWITAVPKNGGSVKWQ